MKIKFWAAIFATGLLAIILESSFWALPMVVWWWWWVSRRVSWQELIWISLVAGVLMDSLKVRALGWSSLILLAYIALLWWIKEKVGREEIEWLVVLLMAIVWSGFWGWGWGVGKIIMVVLVTGIEILLIERLGSYSAIRLRR